MLINKLLLSRQMTTVQTNGHGPDNKNNMILNKAKRDFNKDLNRLPHKKGWKGI